MESLHRGDSGDTESEGSGRADQEISGFQSRRSRGNRVIRGAKVGEDMDFPRAGGPPGDGLRLGSFRVAMEARENRGLPARGGWEWCQTKSGSLVSY